MIREPSQIPAALQRRVRAPRPDHVAASRPLAVGGAAQQFSAGIRLERGLPDVGQSIVHQQVRAHAPAPTRTQEDEIAGRPADIHVVGHARIVDQRISAQAEKGYGMARSQIVSEFETAVVEGDVGEVRANQVARQIAEIASSKRSQPRAAFRVAKPSFAYDVDVAEANRYAKEWAGCAAVARMDV